MWLGILTGSLHTTGGHGGGHGGQYVVQGPLMTAGEYTGTGI